MTISDSQKNLTSGDKKNGKKEDLEENAITTKFENIGIFQIKIIINFPFYKF